VAGESVLVGIFVGMKHKVFPPAAEEKTRAKLFFKKKTKNLWTIFLNGRH
jgi:hypothetical protein